MIITVDLPPDACGKHRIKFSGDDFDGIYFVHRYTYGAFKMTVYYDTNRYVEFDFLNDTVRFDYSVGYQYTINHYSKFNKTQSYVFDCYQNDLFHPIKENEKDDF